MSRSPAPLHTSTSTEEDGSGWAAQRAGATPDVGWREEPAERVPLASTPVASRPPGMQSSQRQRSPMDDATRRLYGVSVAVFREDDGECRLPRARLHVDATAVLPHDPLGDGQP